MASAVVVAAEFGREAALSNSGTTSYKKMHTINIPDHFAHTITELYGEAGLERLARLSSLVADCAQQWSLTVLPPFEPLSYNYVPPAIRSDGTDVVLRVGFPNSELFTAINVLRFYDGCGIVQLLEANREQGVLLLERLNPGTPLSKERNNRMQRLWRPAPDKHAFPSVVKWAKGLQRLRDRFEGGTGPLPRLVDMSEH